MFKERRTDAEAQKTVADHREQFSDGPIGIWCSSLDYELGLGFDGTGLLGNKIEFRPDGTGLLVSWGTGTDGEQRFRWRPIGRCRLLIDAESDAGEESEMSRLMDAVRKQLPLYGLISFSDIADRLNEVPWDVLMACRRLVRSREAREGTGKQRGSFGL